MGELLDLLAATKTIRHHDRGRPCRLDCRQQSLVGNGLRNLKLAGFKSEGPSHPAAACLDELDLRPCLAQQRDFAGRSAKDGLVMAVAVDEDMRAFQPAACKIRCLRGEKVRQKPSILFRQP